MLIELDPTVMRPARPSAKRPLRRSPQRRTTARGARGGVATVALVRRRRVRSGRDPAPAPDQPAGTAPRSAPARQRAKEAEQDTTAATIHKLDALIGGQQRVDIRKRCGEGDRPQAAITKSCRRWSKSRRSPRAEKPSARSEAAVAAIRETPHRRSPNAPQPSDDLPRPSRKRAVSPRLNQGSRRQLQQLISVDGVVQQLAIPYRRRRRHAGAGAHGDRAARGRLEIEAMVSIATSASSNRPERGSRSTRSTSPYGVLHGDVVSISQTPSSAMKPRTAARTQLHRADSSEPTAKLN